VARRHFVDLFIFLDNKRKELSLTIDCSVSGNIDNSVCDFNCGCRNTFKVSTFGYLKFEITYACTKITKDN